MNMDRTGVASSLLSSWLYIILKLEPVVANKQKLPNCYRHNLTGPRDGPRAIWAEGNYYNSLQIGFCANVSRARMAVYLRIV
jgi:hypothetical protein